jgi:hypothetical protein
MTLIFYTLSAIIGLIVLMLIIAALVKKEYGVVREVRIKKPKSEVFNYLKFLKHQDEFSKWALMDPKMKKEHFGIDGTIGFVSGWDSENKNVGKGEQEIKRISEGKKIDYEIRFIRPFTSVADAYLSTEEIAENETLVKWGFESKMKYPMNLMLLFMDMNKMVGNDLSVGLSNLKALLEK